MLSLFTGVKNILIITLIATIVTLSITILQKNRTITKLEEDLSNAKKLNNYYDLQFKALADSYKASLEKFENKKKVIHTVYKDRIKTAVKVMPDEECEYLKQRIKEYVKNSNNSAK